MPACINIIPAACAGAWALLSALLCGCRDQAPWQARAATFAAVVSALGRCMAMRYSRPAENLWRAAAEAFNAVCTSLCASLHRSSVAHMCGV